MPHTLDTLVARLQAADRLRDGFDPAMYPDVYPFDVRFRVASRKAAGGRAYRRALAAIRREGRKARRASW